MCTASLRVLRGGRPHKGNAGRTSGGGEGLGVSPGVGLWEVHLVCLRGANVSGLGQLCFFLVKTALGEVKIREVVGASPGPWKTVLAAVRGRGGSRSVQTIRGELKQGRGEADRMAHCRMGVGGGKEI